MNIIVAVDNNWAIGYQNELLVSIPADKKLFREETVGKVIIMGRKTLESLPAGQPLQGRLNVVLTRQKDYRANGALVVHSMEEALEAVKDYAREDIYVIGGASIYEQFLPMCETVHATKIDYNYQADTYFPNLDQLEEWELTEESDEHTYDDLEYYFQKYQRKK